MDQKQKNPENRQEWANALTDMIFEWAISHAEIILSVELVPNKFNCKTIELLIPLFISYFNSIK